MAKLPGLPPRPGGAAHLSLQVGWLTVFSMLVSLLVLSQHRIVKKRKEKTRESFS